MRLLHNELADVVSDRGQQRCLPPLHKPPQHVAGRSFNAEWIAVLKNHQAHQHHTDVQHLVILDFKKKEAKT